MNPVRLVERVVRTARIFLLAAVGATLLARCAGMNAGGSPTLVMEEFMGPAADPGIQLNGMS
jgi:hypothetical protein